MTLFKPDERSFAEKAIKWMTLNPFRPSLGDEEAGLMGLPPGEVLKVIAWRPGAALWGPHSVYSDELEQRLSELRERLARRLQSGASASEEELGRYELLSLYCLYNGHGEVMDRFIDDAVRGHSNEDERPRVVRTIWDDFRREHEALFHNFPFDFPTKYQQEHVFACFFLFRRAFYHIFFNIVGTSKPISDLRGAVWESILTHDLLGWMQGLHRRMRDFPTLITGPSGAGKELVAQAIGRAQYVPFDPVKKAFVTDFVTAYQPVNLSALPPLLIEAELFGHVKGAFAGAVCDRVGRLDEEACPEHGAVFLDEIGELSAEIQVKLLRVLQTRRFQRVGENEDRDFLGKVIAATNRDLAEEMRARHFREDFYYRLCADQIITPSLQDQLADCPEDLPLMLEFVSRSVVGEGKSDELAREVVAWVEKNLPGYTWPGNFRELEQCVRSYTIRKEYKPIQVGRPRGDPVAEACETLAEAVLGKKMAYDEIERLLFIEVRRGTHTDQEAATLLGRDYRTLQSRLKGVARRRREARKR